jgi:hypothetical protein
MPFQAIGAKIGFELTREKGCMILVAWVVSVAWVLLVLVRCVVVGDFGLEGSADAILMAVT